MQINYTRLPDNSLRILYNISVFEPHEIAVKLGKIFSDHGFEIYLVGGCVRDMFLQKTTKDLDFTTNAKPEQTSKILRSFCDDYWEIGKKFGTIGGIKDGMQIEVTTYRSDKYDHKTRKPEVIFGDSLEVDLSRRDFTINAMALKLPDVELVDPYGGLNDLSLKVIKTPIDPKISFSDDPLRMLRAVRFCASLGFQIEDNTAKAIIQKADTLTMISTERVNDELTKTILSNNPSRGIKCMVNLGLNKYVIPELDALKMEIDPLHHHKDVYEHSLKVLDNTLIYEEEYLGQNNKPDLIVRLSALLHDIGKPKTRKFGEGGKVTFQMHDMVGAKMAKNILKNLKFSNDIIKNVSKLISLHMRFYGYGEQKWTDSAVRRYVNDAGDQLERLHILTRSDVTTRNERKALYLAHAYDDIIQRINELKKQEELNAIRPDLNGHQIMEILNLKPGHENGRLIGKAYDYMLDLRMEDGPKDYETAKKELLNWAKDNSII